MTNSSAFTAHLASNVTEISCQAGATHYTVNVTYANGAQVFSYSTNSSSVFNPSGLCRGEIAVPENTQGSLCAITDGAKGDSIHPDETLPSSAKDTVRFMSLTSIISKLGQSINGSLETICSADIRKDKLFWSGCIPGLSNLFPCSIPLCLAKYF